MSKKTNKYVVVGASNCSDNISMKIFDTKQDAYNYMKLEACSAASEENWGFLYRVTESGKVQILSRRSYYEGIEEFNVESNSAAVMFSNNDRQWWEIKKIPA